MKRLNNTNRLVEQVLGRQPYHENVKYRPSVYTIMYSVEDGAVYLNTLTKQIVLIENSDPIDVALFLLVREWFYVPVDTDETTMLYMTDRVISNVTSKQSRNNIINSVIIFPTSDCNARCPYCYEQGCDRRSMSDQTAIDVADWISRQVASTNRIRIRWFGGEPLYNTRAIDLITSRLKENGTRYRSFMISNGYLIDDPVVNKMLEWNLRRIQITLDGLEDTHDSIKGIDGCFNRVMSNIERVLNAGIAVNVRLGYSQENSDELYSLTDLLHERFGSYEKLSVYTRNEYENVCGRGLLSETERETTYEGMYKLQDHINSYGFGHPVMRDFNEYITNHCMADSKTTVVINPDGGLSICEHYPDHIFGTIYDEYKRNNRYDRYWSEPVLDKEECKTCFYKPMCRKLAHCESDDICNKVFVARQMSYLIAQCKEAYQKYKSKGGG